MANNKIDIIKLARQKGEITKYSNFCKTKFGKKTALTEDEISYYTSLERKNAN